MKQIILMIAVLFSVAVHADEYKYAPIPKIVQGTRKLTCVGVKYDNWEMSAAKCKTVAKKTAEFYEKASRGLLKFKLQSGQVTVPGLKNGANFKKAVALAKQKFPNQDMWQVIGDPGTSNAANKVAHLRGALYRDAQHEVGHLLGLGHSGRYVEQKNGTWKLEAYGDGLSVMGRFPSTTLAAPQYYSRGWLLEKEAALYEAGKTYEIKKTTDFNKEMLALVIVKREDGRDAYISFPSKCDGDSCLVLHLAAGNGGGTQKVATFGKEYHDKKFTGMHIKILEKSASSVKFKMDIQKPEVVKKDKK